MLKHRHFGKEIRNTLKVLKCGAREGRRSDGLIHEKMKCYKAQRKKRMSYKTYNKGRLTGLVTICVGTDF